jgi:hypothetical protein
MGPGQKEGNRVSFGTQSFVVVFQHLLLGVLAERMLEEVSVSCLAG